MVTQYNEQKKAMQCEYDKLGELLTKFCRLCYFVRYSDMFFSYEKRVKNGDESIVKESADSFIHAIEFLAKEGEKFAFEENAKKDYPFGVLDEYIIWVNLIRYEFSHKNNRELNFRDYMPYPPAGMTKINYTKLIKDISFGHNINPEYFYTEYLGDIAEALEVEVIEPMKQLSYKINIGLGQNFKDLMKYSRWLFISSVLVPLLCLLLPQMCFIYWSQFILFVGFIIISYKIYSVLKDIIKL